MLSITSLCVAFIVYRSEKRYVCDKCFKEEKFVNSIQCSCGGKYIDLQIYKWKEDWLYPRSGDEMNAGIIDWNQKPPTRVSARKWWMMRIKNRICRRQIYLWSERRVLSEPNPLKAVRRVLRDKEREGDLFVQRVSASCLRWIRAIVAYRMSSGHLQSM